MSAEQLLDIDSHVETSEEIEESRNIRFGNAKRSGGRRGGKNR